MSTLVVYGDNMSQTSRAVIGFCRMNNIAFELKETSPLNGGTFTPEFKKINPMRLVPVLVDISAGPPLTLTESCTILRYLATT